MLNWPYLGKARKMKDQDAVKREKGPAAGVGKHRDLPPDGAYGWVVVIAAFLINAILRVILFFYEMVIMEILYDYYGYRVRFRAQSLINVMHLISGPLASILMNRFGSRLVAISGALIVTFAVPMSCLLPNFGIIGGFGFGMMYLPAVVSVSFYFEKRRALTTGIVFYGSWVGYFISTLLYKVFINYHVMLMLAAVCLPLVVCGALLRPLRASSTRQKKPEKMFTNDNFVDEVNDRDQQVYVVKGKKQYSDSQLDVERQKKQQGSIYLRRPSSAMVSSVTSLPVVIHGSCGIIGGGGIHKVMRSFVQSSGLYLLADPLFLILVLANVVATLGRSIPRFYDAQIIVIWDAITGDITALVMLVMFIIASLGQILVGFLGDLRCALLLHFLAIASSGIACHLHVSVLTDFNDISYGIFYAYFGLCMDAWRVLSPLILCELLGLEKLTSSYGILCFVQGISLFAGPQITVWIFEVLRGNLDGTFIIGGMLLCFGGSISSLLGLPYFQHRTYANRRLAQK